MNKKNDSGLLLSADCRAWAIEKHGDQRYNEFPFVHHLDQVVHVLLDYGHDDYGLVPAAYLHDVVEDTPVTLADVGDRYGSVIRDLVDAVTNKTVDIHGNALGNRRNRQAYTHAHLRNIAAKHGDMVVNLKLADRIANISFSMSVLTSGSYDATTQTLSLGKLTMYGTEHAAFVAGVRPAGGDPRMWTALDALVAAIPAIKEQHALDCALARGW